MLNTNLEDVQNATKKCVPVVKKHGAQVVFWAAAVAMVIYSPIPWALAAFWTLKNVGVRSNDGNNIK
jgi:hypothetical protein